MLLQSLPLVFVLIGVALYTVLAGADFGAGLWQLLAGGSARGQRIREYAHRSMAPVWEANHVWVIFVLTVFWTAYPQALSSIASTLAIPLFIAVLGIIFRGAAYAFREGARSNRESGVIDTMFSLSSILTPFALGAAIGGIATDRVPVGNAAGNLFSSWLNPTSILIGVLAVTTSAYLAAVFLAADAARDESHELERAFRTRALGAASLAGAVAFGGLFIVKADDHKLFHSLLSGRGLAGVIASALAGLLALALVRARKFEAARYLAAVAVAAIIAGWALARWPTILPGLSVYRAAAGHDTLVWVIASVLGGGAIVFPSLALLFRLALQGRFRAREEPAFAATLREPPGSKVGLLARSAVACLIAGFALLTVADASWAHAVGVVFLLCFIGIGFRAIIVSVLAATPANR